MGAPRPCEEGGRFAPLAVVAAAFGAAGSTEKYKLAASLKTRSEVPAPKGASGATGIFTGTLLERADHRTIVWRLTFAHLTGAAGAAHIHAGRPGHAGRCRLAVRAVPQRPARDVRRQ